MADPIFVNLTGSVGTGGSNAEQDVLIVKSRLKQLGYYIPNETIVLDDDTTHAIKLFQAIKNGQQSVNSPGTDGLIDVDGETHKWLNAVNAPEWQKMPEGSVDAGYINVEVTEELKDDHDFGTNWLANFIEEAALSYLKDFLLSNPEKAVIAINDASRDHGVDTKDHKGHETGMCFDMRLPLKNGKTPPGTTHASKNYDRDTMRAILQAFHKHPFFSKAFFNDKQLIDEGLCQALKGHDNHVHIDMKPQPRGAENKKPKPIVTYAKCINKSGADMAVYGPKQPSSNSTFDFELYRLPNDMKTPDEWDCRGVYIPNDVTIFSFPDIIVPTDRALVYYAPNIAYLNIVKGKVFLSPNDGIYKVGEINLSIPNIPQAQIANLPTVPSPDPAGQISYGKAINATPHPIAVYGPKPKGSTSTFDNQLYKLPAFSETPPEWDCDGIFVPNDRKAVQRLISDIQGPKALGYTDLMTFTVNEDGNQYILPIRQKEFPPGGQNWEVPDKDSTYIDTLQDVPDYLPMLEEKCGRIINKTDAPILVYGPRRDIEAEDNYNSIYKLMPGKATPPNWDANGIFLPKGEKARQKTLSLIDGPKAIKYPNGSNAIIRKVKGILQLPANMGVFSPAEHCITGLFPAPEWLMTRDYQFGWPYCVPWPIPDIDQVTAEGAFPDVPDAVPDNKQGFQPQTGSQKLDNILIPGSTEPPLAPGNADHIATGVIQDLLQGHGYLKMPNYTQNVYGLFGPNTRATIVDFCQKNKIPIDPNQPQVDRTVLLGLLTVPASTPYLSRAYTEFTLGIPWTIWLELLRMVCLQESRLFFQSKNKNTDKQGLSYGLIQWAQKQGRLKDVVDAYQKVEPILFKQIFGGKDLSEGLLIHVSQADGGVDANGISKDPKYKLTDDNWLKRFNEASLKLPWQKTQIELALKVIKNFYQTLQQKMPAIVSMRGVAFMLDLVNQHGDPRVAEFYKSSIEAGIYEAKLLQKITVKSVELVETNYGVGSDEAIATKTRRDFFRLTKQLSDSPFDPSKTY